MFLQLVCLSVSQLVHPPLHTLTRSIYAIGSRTQAVPPTRLKGVVENLDDEDSTSGRPRVLTKRGTDVGGFFAADDNDDDDNEVERKTVSRSSTTSSGFSQQKRLEESRKVSSENRILR